MADATGWYTIDTPPPVGVEVDLWRNGERLINFALDEHGRWCRKEGYPVVQRILIIQPTHWRYPPEPPQGL